MNREIKFRAWNGETMNYNIIAGKFGAFWVNPGSKNNGLDERDSASLTPFNTKCNDNTIVMQFTGSCDKNQKEIYEGDLCKYYTKLGVIVGVIEWENQAGAFWLKWNEKSESGRVFHRYKELKATFSDGEIYMIENIEVISHRYEDTNESKIIPNTN